jgi:hypothetical protein
MVVRQQSCVAAAFGDGSETARKGGKWWQLDFTSDKREEGEYIDLAENKRQRTQQMSVVVRCQVGTSQTATWHLAALDHWVKCPGDVVLEAVTWRFRVVEVRRGPLWDSGW